jgi:hypothetical protein
VSGPGELIRLSLRLWPLPPSGPLTLTGAWIGRRAASLVLHADAIRAAAGRAQPFWPEQS